MSKSISIALVAFLAMFSFQGVHADLITEWTMEVPTTPPDVSNSAVGPTVDAFTGTGSLHGLHDSPDSDWSTPAGNGSTDSYSVNTWTVGDYFQFTTSSSGYQGLEVCFDQTSSNTGPRDFGLSYSATGPAGPYTNHASYAVLANAAPNPVWSGTGPQHPEFRTCYDLSGVAALDNQASISFRLTNDSTVSANGGTVAAGGTSRVDNVTVSGTLIPEPASSLFALTGMVLLISARRRG